MKPFSGELDKPLKPFSGTMDGEKPTFRPSDALKDTGLAALKGAIGLPEAIVGIGDLITGGNAGKLAESVGFRPSEARQVLDDSMSDYQKAAKANVQGAEGFVPTLVEAVKNPTTIAESTIESLPSVLGGGVIGRGAKALGLSPLAAAATGEGVMSAGATAEQVRQQTTDGLLNPEQAALATGSGMLTGALNLAGGAAARKLGISDIDTLVAGGPAAQTNKGLLRRVAEGAFSEGVLEELPQSAQEQIAQNLALGKPWSEGVDQAAAMGMLAGGLMGAGGGVFTGKESQPGAQPGPMVSTDGQPPAGGSAPGMPSFSFEDVTNIGARTLDQLQARDPATLTDQERQEMDFLGANLANPQAIAQRYGFNMRPPEFTEDMLNKALGTMEAQAAMDQVVMKYQKEREQTQQPVNASILDMVNEARAQVGQQPLDQSRWDRILNKQEPTTAPPPKAEEAAKRVFPFSTESAAMKYAQTRYGEGGFTITPHPSVAGRFAVQPKAAAGETQTSRPAEKVQEPQKPAGAPQDAGTPAAPKTIDDGAHLAATSPKNDLAEPTDAQKLAGNYKKGSVRVAGLDLSIENPQGSTRKNKDPNGDPWETTMADHYGYIKGSIAADSTPGNKQGIDAFVKPGTTEDFAGKAYVVDQRDPKTGKFDEHKVMLGYDSADEARAAYLANYAPDWKGLMNITPTTMDDLKEWMKTPATKRPFILRRIDQVQRMKVKEMGEDDAKLALLTDTLTGLPNLRAFEERGERLPVQARADLDGFKGVNDKFGHDAGNEVLKAIARILDRHRGDGQVYRIGGDEFPSEWNSVEEARAAMEAVRQDFAETEFTFTLPDGSEKVVKGLGFSYGIGKDEASAEAALQGDKLARKQAGLRREREDNNPGGNAESAQGQQAEKRPDSGQAVSQPPADTQQTPPDGGVSVSEKPPTKKPKATGPLADIPPIYLLNTKVKTDRLYNEATKQYESGEISAKDALDGVNEDIDVMEALKICLGA